MVSKGESLRHKLKCLQGQEGKVKYTSEENKGFPLKSRACDGGLSAGDLFWETFPRTESEKAKKKGNAKSNWFLLRKTVSFPLPIF
jgi:hypothetical protein